MQPVTPLTPERRDLALANVRLAYRLASLLWPSVRPRLDQEETRAAALLGLCRAAGLYDPARGTKFSTYAWHCVRTAVLDAARHGGTVSVSYRRASASPDAARAARWRASPLGEGPDVEAPPEPCPLAAADAAREAGRVREAVARLPGRQARAVRLYYWDGKTLAEAGRELGLTRERVRQILLAARGRLGEMLGGHEP